MKDTNQTPKQPQGKGKPYQAPMILSREPLEALAAVCSQPGAKDYPTNPGCDETVAFS